MFAIWIAASMAFKEGLQRIWDVGWHGHFSVDSVGLVSASLAVKKARSSSWMEWLLSETAVASAFLSSSLDSMGGLSVSKHMTPSKQSSKPSLLRTWATWALSALVKICKHNQHHPWTKLDNFQYNRLPSLSPRFYIFKITFGNQILGEKVFPFRKVVEKPHLEIVNPEDLDYWESIPPFLICTLKQNFLCYMHWYCREILNYTNSNRGTLVPRTVRNRIPHL